MRKRPRSTPLIVQACCGNANSFAGGRGEVRGGHRPGGLSEARSLAEIYKVVLGHEL